MISSGEPTRVNADSRRGVIGMKNGLGHGELIWRSVDDAVERIEGIRNKTGFVLDKGVLGSRLIGLKKINSVFKESGEEQSLGVSDDEPSWLLSDSAGLEVDDSEVDGVFVPELLLAIFVKNVIPRLNAVLKMLLYLVFDEASLVFVDELPDDAASLKPKDPRDQKVANCWHFWI